MATIDFIKMNGLKNDFAVVDQTINRIKYPSQLAKVISDRTYGIGCDQMILLDQSEIADLKMMIYNRDGGQANMCGNALRCVGKYLMSKHNKQDALIEINNKKYPVRKENRSIAVNIGQPIFDWDKIPLAHKMDTLFMEYEESVIANNKSQIKQYKARGAKCINIHESTSNDVMLKNEVCYKSPAAVNVGNPHIIFFVDNPVESIDLDKIGPKIETDSLFPEGVNVTFAQTISANTFKLRVWERGTGETFACGSAACAVAAVASARNILNQPLVTIMFKYGKLMINLLKDKSIEIIGDAEVEYNGKFLWNE